MLMLPDFNRLKVFYHVVRCKGPTAAARDLFITQSAVSQHIKKLEEELGTKLFTRSYRQWTPTPAAERLYRSVGGFIEELNRTVYAIDREREGPFGLLRVGAPVEFGGGDLAASIAEFRELYPDVRFDLMLGVPEALLPALFEGRLDMAFCDNGAYFARNPLLRSRPVLSESLVLVCSRRYHRAHLDGGHTLERLARCSFIDYVDTAAPLRWWFDHHFGRMPQSLHIAVRVENVHAIHNLVRRDVGLALLPERLVEPELRKRSLVKIATGRKEVENRIDLIHPKGKDLSVTERTFVEFVLRNYE